VHVEEDGMGAIDGLHEFSDWRDGYLTLVNSVCMASPSPDRLLQPF